MTMLAAYGTLRYNQARSVGMSAVLSTFYIGQDTIRGYMYDVGPFPAVVDGNSDIVVDLFDVPDDMWESLDMYEGVPSLYTRETTTTGNGKEVQYYKFAQEIGDLKRIVSGDWYNKAYK